METPEVGVKNLGDSSPLMQSKGYKDVKSIGASLINLLMFFGICNEVATLDQEDMVIDESNFGEPWVQGLMEGEYSDLSVEERLSAMRALIGIANEGNSIRIILEACLEAANALKKQMCTEVQLDKCRMKEEYVMKIHPTTILGSVSGLKHGLHGFHIHALGDTTNGCMATGNFHRPQIHLLYFFDENRHAGDLGNITVGADGTACFTIVDKQIPLCGPNSIIGRAVVVHGDPDDLGKGGHELSPNLGNLWWKDCLCPTKQTRSSSNINLIYSYPFAVMRFCN
ncbi:Superoxide dismutase [Cu-Zn] [Camellia lanceoleosa]|uniref:Superoxide dismutase [Cu-Zn] n=1 Tax=Camellia lanceoleosa TaxID=1840588 RepID=A0ACC0G7W8_9ERIC|nr:Superoxide dismutase [Cu-Zn] [Camellia lanceoleosa]